MREPTPITQRLEEVGRLEGGRRNRRASASHKRFRGEGEMGNSTPAIRDLGEREETRESKPAVRDLGGGGEMGEPELIAALSLSLFDY